MKSVFTPAHPAAVLLYGMVFAVASTYFTAIAWLPSMTAVFYMVPLVWVLALTWRKRSYLLPLTHIDVLFMGFVLLVLGSLVFQGGLQSGGWRYVRYLPFMVIVPYLCGRLMRVHDIDMFSRIVMYAGLGVLPLLLLGHMDSSFGGGARGLYFGQDDGALRVGALLAAALLATCARGSTPLNSGGNIKSRLIHYGLIGLMAGFLVWVSARGWLISAIAGLVVLVLSAYRDKGLRSAYFRRLAFVVAVVLLSLAVLPRSSSQFYSALLTESPQIWGSTQVVGSKILGSTQVVGPKILGSTQVVGPILGEESCRPFKEGVNSVAMRWVLYREAVEMFARFPTLGVGAARFGDRSCTGTLGFPHSTILQGFSELGLVGGSLLAGLLLFAVFTLIRRLVFTKSRTNEPAGSFALALFAAFLVSDQIYGNYFMSTGVYLMLGLAAGMLADEKQDCLAHV